MKTKSGRYIIFDITEFLPGKPIPSDYDTTNGPWFFRPADWVAPDWGGVTVAKFRGFPFAYSPGYAEPEQALAAAEEWEGQRPWREEREAAFQAFFAEGADSVRLGR